MSERSASTAPWSSTTRYAGSRPAAPPSASTSSYSSAGVATSPYPCSANTPRSVSPMARSSRISSGRTSRVPEGIGMIVTRPAAYEGGAPLQRRDAVPRAERPGADGQQRHEALDAAGHAVAGQRVPERGRDQRHGHGGAGGEDDQRRRRGGAAVRGGEQQDA